MGEVRMERERKGVEGKEGKRKGEEKKGGRKWKGKWKGKGEYGLGSRLRRRI